jgi:hypothetical protein
MHQGVSQHPQRKRIVPPIGSSLAGMTVSVRLQECTLPPRRLPVGHNQNVIGHRFDPSHGGRDLACAVLLQSIGNKAEKLRHAVRERVKFHGAIVKDT